MDRASEFTEMIRQIADNAASKAVEMTMDRINLAQTYSGPVPKLRNKTPKPRASGRKATTPSSSRPGTEILTPSSTDFSLAPTFALPPQPPMAPSANSETSSAAPSDEAVGDPETRAFTDDIQGIQKHLVTLVTRLIHVHTVLVHPFRTFVHEFPESRSGKEILLKDILDKAYNQVQPRVDFGVRLPGNSYNIILTFDVRTD